VIKYREFSQLCEFLACITSKLQRQHDIVRSSRNAYLSNENSFLPRNIPGVNNNCEAARVHLKASLSLTCRKTFKQCARMFVQLIKSQLTKKKSFWKTIRRFLTYRITKQSNKYQIKAVTRIKFWSGNSKGYLWDLEISRETRNRNGRKMVREVVKSISLKLILLN